MTRQVNLLKKHQRAPLMGVLLACLAGCAPAGHLRPLTPMLPDHAAELGLAHTVVGPRPVGQDDWAHGAQAWSTWQPTAAFDLSFVGVFADGFTGGLALRWRAFESPYFAAGLGAELGVGWIALNLPIAARVQERVWLYSAPQFGSWGIDLESVRLPLGVDVRVADEVHVRGEAQLNYPDFDPFKRRVHMGLGLAFRL